MKQAATTNKQNKVAAMQQTAMESTKQAATTNKKQTNKRKKSKRQQRELSSNTHQITPQTVKTT